ncbi:hypothetical protein ACWD3J_48195 [Streptomyces sp. NPDC002755]|uniref:hypothetical protein n=1 Tax=Streptomyces sp. NPDC002884 TaxID=3154544 RepID=UPI0033232BE0
MADPNPPDHASEDAPNGADRATTGTSRVRFPLTLWVLAPLTTWQARHLAADFGEGMDAGMAWKLARLRRHPDELGYAMHLKDEELPG